MQVQVQVQVLWLQVLWQSGRALQTLDFGGAEGGGGKEEGGATAKLA